MPKAAPAQTAFNAGELSPRLAGRVDLAKYTSGCYRLRNFLPTIQGPAIKRSGTRYLKEIRSSANGARLVAFEFGTTQAYVLEFGNLYCRVGMNSGGVLETAVAVTVVAATSPITITTGAAHGYADDEQVYVSGTLAGGINGSYYNINVTGATTFELLGTASLGAFGAGGTVERVHQFVTPYTTADLDGLSFTQSADVLYIAHHSYAPRKLSRTGHTSWTLTEIDFDWQPFAPENLDEDSYVVASAVTGTGVNLWSSAGEFTAAHVGSYFRLREDIETYAPEWKPGIRWSANPDIYEYFGTPMNNGGRCWYESNVYELIWQSAGATGAAAPIHKDGTRTDGNWFWKYLHSGAGYVKITGYTSANKVTADVVKRLPESTTFAPKAVTVIANTTPIQITTGTNHTLTTGDSVWIEGTLLAGINDQSFTITRINNTQFSLNGTVAAGAFGAGGQAIRLYSTTTTPTAASEQYTRSNLWSFGAWSPARGYPRACAFFEDRLWFAGSDSDPQGLWASRTGRYEDHEAVDQDDSSLVFILNTQQVNEIVWLSSGRKLAVGTVGGEFVLQAAGEGAVTPGNAMAPQHSTHGSRTGVQALRVDSSTIFAQRAGRKLLQYGFDFDTDTFQGVDLAVLADHLTVGGIKGMAWAQEPDRTLWVWRDDGGLLAIAYDRQQEVTGWAKIELGGTAVAVKSAAVIPHPDGTRDQLWLIVSRTINGGTKQYVEILDPTWLHGETALVDGFFVDSGASYNGAPATTITGLWHLIGESVAVLADGLIQAEKTVSATGTISITSASKAAIGLGYDAQLTSMRLEAGAADGTAQGKTKRIPRVVVRLEETGEGLLYGPDLDEYQIDAGTLYSGDTSKLPWPGGYEQAARVNLEHNQPTPCTVVAIFPQVATEDG